MAHLATKTVLEKQCCKFILLAHYFQNKNKFIYRTKRYISLRNKISEYQGITSDMTVQAEIKKCTKEKQKTLAAAVKTRESFQKKKHYLNALKSRADYQLTDAVEMLKLKMWVQI